MKVTFTNYIKSLENVEGWQEKNPTPWITKMEYNDLTITSLPFGWFALPNFCVCNEGKGDGNDAVSCRQLFCAISQDAKCAFITHMMCSIISMYVFILWTLPYLYRHWDRNINEPPLPLLQVILKLLCFHMSSTTMYSFSSQMLSNIALLLIHL